MTGVIPLQPGISNYVINIARERGRILWAEKPTRRVKPFLEPVIGPKASYGSFYCDQANSYIPQDVGLISLAGASMLGADGLVWCDGAFIRDSTKFVVHWHPESLVASADYSDDHNPRITLKAPIALPTYIFRGSYISAAVGSWTNFSHWLIEGVSRIFAFLLLRKHDPGLKLIIPPFAPGGFHEQTLRLFGINESDTIKIGYGETLTFEKLYSLNVIDIWSVQTFAGMAASALMASAAVTEPMPATDKPRIWLHRATGSRRLANFDELRPMIESFGFSITSFDNVPLIEQIAALRDATHVVGEHGAALTNIIFSRQGARVLELFNPTCVQPAFWSLASMKGLDYGALVGADAGNESSWNSDYIIKPQSLRRALECLLSIKHRSWGFFRRRRL